ncbi:MAG: threonine synthase [Candidatus Pacebacteria bacterium]|nr:threonine synthase [Candidatus Paceibacterota bacterium]
MDDTWLSCIECGNTVNIIKERSFRCPYCGNLYEVKHRLPLDISPSEFISRFDERARRSFQRSINPMYRSGVWRFREWIMPYMPLDKIVTLGEGNVPIVPAGDHLKQWIGDIDLHIIMEGMTPTGSFKDFGGTVMMSLANVTGVKAVACASTGDTSAMAAAYSTALGIKCAVILPEGQVTAVQMAQPLVHGAKIILLPGDFDDCMSVMQDLVSDYGVYPANSLNPSRIEGHQATVFLIAQYFDWNLPDWIALPVGNGSNCSSVGKAMRTMRQLGIGMGSKILGCQSEAANPLARSWRGVYSSVGEVSLPLWKNMYEPVKVGDTAATAARIGDPVSREKVMREITFFDGAMEEVSEHDLRQAVAVCGRDGHFVCPQTGIALAGIRNALSEGLIDRGELVVAVSTATGLKFTGTAVERMQDNIISAPDCSTETVARIVNS